MANHWWITAPGLARIRSGPLVPYLDGFAELLAARGYVKSSVKRKTRLIIDLSHWLQRRGLGISRLDEQRVDVFLRHRQKTLRYYCGERVALQLLLKQLRDIKVIPAAAPITDVTELQKIERAFAQYLSLERGLAPLTVSNYVPYIRRFLSERFGTKPIRFEELTPSDVNRHILRYSTTFSPRGTQAIAIALRIFFRFLHLRGSITADLAAAVPRVVNWRLTTVPKFLKPEQVEALLKCCNRGTVMGQRDYTVLLLLARLGLRAGEVVKMRLGDIDWEVGELTVRGKNSQQDRLPIPTDVGEALATYLQRGRPSSLTRHVFVRMNAPHRGFKTSAAITYLVSKALRRAGLDPTHKGPHILRHSLATHMLRKGASLVEVGEVLRHRFPNSTKIYAKVDFNALRALAQPWPGEEVEHE